MYQRFSRSKLVLGRNRFLSASWDLKPSSVAGKNHGPLDGLRACALDLPAQPSGGVKTKPIHAYRHSMYGMEYLHIGVVEKG